MLCRHCHLTSISRPRGLCWNCYYTPNVRDLYPSTSKFGRRGLGIFRGQAKRPEFPTDALPGSEEKIHVLMQRAEMREDLWHPDDADWSGSHAEPELMEVG